MEGVLQVKPLLVQVNALCFERSAVLITQKAAHEYKQGVSALREVEGMSNETKTFIRALAHTSRL